VNRGRSGERKTSIGGFHCLRRRCPDRQPAWDKVDQSGIIALLHDEADVCLGIRLGDAWEYWRGLGIDERELVVRHGWPLAGVRTMDAYRDKDMVYRFPALAEIREHTMRLDVVGSFPTVDL